MLTDPNFGRIFTTGELNQMIRKARLEGVRLGLEAAAECIGDFHDAGYDEKTLLCPNMMQAIRAIDPAKVADSKDGV